MNTSRLHVYATGWSLRQYPTQADEWPWARKFAAITAAGVMATNTPGVLDKDGNLLTGLTPKEIDDLFADGTLYGGMLPKISSALDAARSGVKSVHIIDGRVEHSLLLEILTDQGVGTLIKAR